MNENEVLRAALNLTITPTPHVGEAANLDLRLAMIRTPFKQVRPGVFERSVKVGVIRFWNRKWECQDCKKGEFDCPSIIDDLWKVICPQNGVICLSCFEKRLGRFIQIADLKASLNNGSLIHVLKTLKERQSATY